MRALISACTISCERSGGKRQSELKEITQNFALAVAKQTAKLLWSIYIGLIVIIMVLFYIQGMTLFDSICHSFTTISTGGFSTHTESIKYFDIASQ